MRRVVVTGLGPISPIATGKDAYWEALREGRNGVGPITTFELGDCPVTFGAEIKDFDPTRWMDGKEAKRSDRAIQFAVAASKLAVEDAKLDTKSMDPYRFGVYIGTGQGGIETSFNNFKTMMEKGSRRVSPYFIPMMISNMSTAYVAIVHGAKGPNLCIVTACATSLHSLGEAYHTIVRDDADVILAGGTEAALRAISIAGFASMKALSTRMDSPETASRPFDKDRDGFVMGEGAGALETIASFQAIEQGYIHPTLNYTTPDPECDITLSTGRGVEKKVDRMLVNSFGFGGHNGVLAFQRFV